MLLIETIYYIYIYIQRIKLWFDITLFTQNARTHAFLMILKLLFYILPKLITRNWYIYIILLL